MKTESWLILKPCLKVLPMVPTGSGFANPPVKGAKPQLWGQADLRTVSSSLGLLRNCNQSSLQLSCFNEKFDQQAKWPNLGAAAKRK